MFLDNRREDKRFWTEWHTNISGHKQTLKSEVRIDYLYYLSSSLVHCVNTYANHADQANTGLHKGNIIFRDVTPCNPVIITTVKILHSL
jgi:hypothetical protein